MNVSGDGFSCRLQKFQAEKNQGGRVIFLKWTLISRASYHLEELCLSFECVWPSVSQDFQLPETSTRSGISKPHFGLKKHHLLLHSCCKNGEKNMEKRHQNPTLSYFWAFFISRQAHVLAQINKRAHRSSKNASKMGFRGSKNGI